MATDNTDESTSEPSDNPDQALQYLAQRFPDMKLTPKPPSMVSVNGIETSLYSSREF